MDKASLRTLYKTKRNDLTLVQRREMNGKIVRHLQHIDWSDSTHVHVYLSIAKHNEFDTQPFISWLKKNYPSIKIVVSKSNFERLTMEHFILDNETILKANKWGIPEPVGGHRVDAQVIDAVIIPLLVADKNGGRVGYGKGFYDRFLLSCRKDTNKIGISYFEPVPIIDDLSIYDYPLSKLITPERIFSFK